MKGRDFVNSTLRALACAPLLTYSNVRCATVLGYHPILRYLQNLYASVFGSGFENIIQRDGYASFNS